MVCLLVQRNEIAKILHKSIPFNFVFIVFILYSTSVAVIFVAGVCTVMSYVCG